MEACSSESTASASEIFYIYVRTRSYYSCLENDRRRRQYYCSNSSLLNKQRSIRAAAVVRLELRWYGRRRVYLTEAVVRVEPRPQPRGCRSTTTHFYFYTTYIDIEFALLVLLLLSRQRQCSSLIVALVHVMRTSSATKKRP